MVADSASSCMSPLVSFCFLVKMHSLCFDPSVLVPVHSHSMHMCVVGGSRITDYVEEQLPNFTFEV